MTKERAIEILQERLDLAEKSGNGVGDYYDVLRVAIESIKQTMWIPVTERLPAARKSVIISTKDWTGEGCYWEATEHHVVWKGYRWNATYWDDEVLAWMPLPEPWEGEVKK